VNIQHSSQSDEWFTPPEIMELVREVLGPINFDPASCEEANKIVQANCYYTENSLTKPWHGTGPIYCNPPGGKTGNKSNVKLFWDKLMDTDFLHAIFMAFSIEALQTTQSCILPMAQYPICIPAKRIRFVSPEGKKSSPSHSNCIVYIPDLIDRTEKFTEVFSRIGVVLNV
jgi:ParB family transcriptional regulator, chromosome partitioning protein